MSILVVSEQKEQAVVSSTLILWRSLGMVLGVASSSLVVQNALVHYLDKFVVGPEKDEVSSTSLSPGASNSPVLQYVQSLTNYYLQKRLSSRSASPFTQSCL